MALNNYANLKQSIKKWSHREDVVGDIADDIIGMTEQEIFYGDNPLRTIEMISESVVATESSLFDLPVNTLEVLNVSILIDGRYLNLRDLPLQQINESDEKGIPKSYSITNSIALDITPDKEYTFKVSYYRKPEPLSEEFPTNFILDKYPTAYLFGGIAMAMLWAGEEDRMNEYVIRMRDVIASANTASQNLKLGATPTIYIDGVIP